MNAPGRLDDVSVITIVRDRSDHLRRLLLGLEQSEVLPSEVRVVDMGSAQDTHAAVAGSAGRLRSCGIDVVVDRMAPSANLPLASARNRGASLSTTATLVFLDVDCIPAPDLLGSFLDAPGHHLVNGPVRYLRTNWTQTGYSWASLQRESAPHPARQRPNRGFSNDRYELFWSLSFAVDAPTFEAIGGFDEGFVGYGGEDTDFAFAARQLEVPMWWNADGPAFHQYHDSPNPPVQHLTDIVNNARYFHSKWGAWPMEGWLTQFAELELIHWTADGTDIAVQSPAQTVFKR